MASVMHQHELAISMHMSPNSWTTTPDPSPHPTPLGCHRAQALGALSHSSNSHWLSVLHMVMYMFQCYCLKSSQSLLPLLCSKIYSLYLCLLCCPASRIIGTIFLDSYIWANIKYLSFTFWHFILYNKL